MTEHPLDAPCFLVGVTIHDERVWDMRVTLVREGFVGFQNREPTPVCVGTAWMGENNVQRKNGTEPDEISPFLARISLIVLERKGGTVRSPWIAYHTRPHFFFPEQCAQFFKGHVRIRASACHQIRGCVHLFFEILEQFYEVFLLNMRAGECSIVPRVVGMLGDLFVRGLLGELDKEVIVSVMVQVMPEVGEVMEFKVGIRVNIAVIPGKFGVGLDVFQRNVAVSREVAPVVIEMVLGMIGLEEGIDREVQVIWSLQKEGRIRSRRVDAVGNELFQGNGTAKALKGPYVFVQGVSGPVL